MSGTLATSAGSEPYGPCTSKVRRFLVQLAGLGNDARSSVVHMHRIVSARADYAAAELVLAETIARSGRIDARDSMAGPLLQLVRRSDTSSTDPLDDLDPIAEPALAALMMLLVSDVLPPSVQTILYAPFDEVISMPTIG